ncbi:NlpC/P60 family protein [Protofrankia sp. BMG5.30]|uniref:NlpC/P60 family protein n=1 Tax=Protofrankia sp. BMG5.30 TaxID=1834514 RepID=UPI000976A057|nr:NlpC/P60 family protein [Protofrankia sp. BMG5.30]ONH34679.1 hypothetical protein BL254_14705 [Protofrankia sp. BMG5.30]
MSISSRTVSPTITAVSCAVAVAVALTPHPAGAAIASAGGAPAATDAALGALTTGQGSATTWTDGQESASGRQKPSSTRKRATGDRQRSTGNRRESSNSRKESTGDRQESSGNEWESSGNEWESSDGGWESSAGRQEFPGRSLRLGSQGDPVARLQIRLGIFADGRFGPRTARGVRTFQSGVGLTIDAVVGPRTWGALFGASAAPAVSAPASAQPVPALLTTPAVAQTAVASTAALTVAPVGASTSVAAAAFAVAQQQIGKPYRYGAAGPNDFDCSGLIKYVYTQVGASVPRTTYDQFAALQPVSRADARPGDVIFFLDAEGEAYHDAIYAGNGQMIVSRRPGTNVQYQEIWSGDYRIGRV